MHPAAALPAGGLDAGRQSHHEPLAFNVENRQFGVFGRLTENLSRAGGRFAEICIGGRYSGFLRIVAQVAIELQRIGCGEGGDTVERELAMVHQVAELRLYAALYLVAAWF